MVVIGLALCYLLGLAVLLTISRKYSLAELAGYSFLLGIGIETVFLFLLDVVGIRYSQGILIGLNVASIAALWGLGFFPRHLHPSLATHKWNEFKFEPDPRNFLQLKNINIPALLIGGIMAYLFYCVTVKCLFWPPLERDSMGSFDKLARVMAIEGKLKISLFQYNLEGAGGVYPPLFHASMAYVYIFGAELPKIITTLFFLSTLLVFFDVVRKYAGATASAFFTFVLMLTPEYFAHAALALGNLPTTAYACAGSLCTIAWLDKREEKFFWLGAILTGFVVWVRSDTIVFTVAALLVMGIDFLRTKNWKRFLVYAVTAVAPFVIWALYLKFKIQVETTASKFDLGIGFNSERFAILKGYIDAYLFGGTYDYKGMGGADGGQLYGLSFILFFVMLLANIAWILYLFFRKGNWKSAITPGLYMLIFFFVSFTLYAALFYFINEKVQAAPLWSLMYSSFKRGIFCFLPLVLFYAATCGLSEWLWGKLEKFRMAA